MLVISVIVPVYKVEKYLRRCLDSIIAQTFIDFECILVDDGSPDGCPAICDEYAAKDSRFVVIHQKNAGVSAARNAGLDIARGNWIGFVDSDDWLESNALEVLYKKQKDTDADIVMGGFREIYPNYTAPYLFPSVTATDDILVYFFNNRCKFLHGKLYRKYLFDNYYVPKTNIGEDALVSVQLFAIITHEKLQKVDLIIYNYDRRTGGIMSQFSNTTNYKAFTDYPMLQACLFMENMVDKIHQNKEIYSSFLRYMLVVGIIPYLSFNRLKSKKEVNLFYQTYYRPCEIKHKIHFINRMIVPLFRFSMGIGTVYVFLLNRVEFLRPFIKRIFYR